MRCVSISFCAGTAHHVADDSAKEEILRDISDRLRVRTMRREARVYRPGAGQDTSGSYVACLQSRGNPYLLLLTRVGFCDTAMYVDRKVRPGHSLPRIIVDHVMFDHDLFDGTVVSGEMVRSLSGEWRFLAEDLLALRGKPLPKSADFRSRYASLVEVLRTAYRFDDASTHRVLAKRYFPADEGGMEALRAHAESSPYGRTGYVLKSLSPSGSNWFVRWDGPGKPLLPFDAKALSIAPTAAPDVFEAYDPKSGAPIGLVCVQSLEVSRELAEAMSVAGERALWDCSWNDEFGKWMALPGGGGAGLVTASRRSAPRPRTRQPCGPASLERGTRPGARPAASAPPPPSAPQSSPRAATSPPPPPR